MAETAQAEPSSIVFDALPAGVKRVEIWLPHTESVEIVALRSDAVLHPSDERRPVWLHHGSSISQGSTTTHPTGTWPAVAASLRGLDLINLGFSGSALLDPFTARVIRDTPADLISLKIGINLVNTDLMRLRAFGPAVHGFLDTIREGHPDTPLIVVSPVHCPMHETTPGPGAFDPAALAAGEMRFTATGDAAEVAAGKLTLTVVREHLARIVGERRVDDPHLHRGHQWSRSLVVQGSGVVVPVDHAARDDPHTRDAHQAPVIVPERASCTSRAPRPSGRRR